MTKGGESPPGVLGLHPCRETLDKPGGQRIVRRQCLAENVIHPTRAELHLIDVQYVEELVIHEEP